MAVDFPTSPTSGQIVFGTGIAWRWDGTAWVIASGASSAHGCLAYAQILAPQSGIGATDVAIGGLSVSWVADPSRRYRTTLVLDVWSSVANDLPISKIKDAGGTQKHRATVPLSGAGMSSSLRCSVVETGLSGSQTRFGTLGRAAGTGSLSVGGAADSPGFIMVEDVTYEGGASPGSLETTKVGRWRRVANQMFTANVQANVAFDTEDYDPWNIGTYNGGTEFRIPESGIWAISCLLQWGGIQSTRSFGQITLSSAVPNHTPQHRVVCTSDDRVSITPTLQLLGGDFFTVMAFCSAANANLTAQLQVMKVANFAP